MARPLKVFPIGTYSDSGYSVSITLPYRLPAKGGRSRTYITARCLYDDCGNEFEILVASFERKDLLNTCGDHKSETTSRWLTGKTRAASPAWLGGKTKHKEGYVLIMEPEHPNAQASGYVLEHVKVMSDHLGRPLIKGETVHHINGQRDDNRIENLQLRLGHHGSGQAYACIDCGSERISPVALKDSQEVALSSL